MIMRTVFFSLMMICSIYCNAQYLSFMDIPLNGSHDEFAKELLAKDFKDITQKHFISTRTRSYKGKYMGHKVQVDVRCNRKNIIYSVYVSFKSKDPQTLWKMLEYEKKKYPNGEYVDEDGDYQIRTEYGTIHMSFHYEQNKIIGCGLHYLDVRREWM